MLTKLCTKYKKIVICGDYNIDRQKNSPVSREFEDLLLSFNLKLAINAPTRLQSKTCIDNIAHNIRGCKQCVLELALSDHTAQILSCPVRKTYSITHWYKFKRDYSNENIEKFKY